MNKLYIPSSDSNPGILFDPDAQQFKIWGKACPEDSFEFYSPVVKWLEDFLQNEKPKHLTLEFELTYYNTASSKVFIKLFQMLEQYQKQQNADIKIIWYYDPDDEEIMLSGEDYREIVKIPFELKPLKIQKTE